MRDASEVPVVTFWLYMNIYDRRESSHLHNTKCSDYFDISVCLLTM